MSSAWRVWLNAPSLRNALRVGVVALASCLGLASVAFSQGVVLSGIGPVNRSMAGAGTACPLDAAGALYLNPASISGLSSSELSAGMSLILPTAENSATIPAGALGNGFPPVTLAGSASAESGVSPAPYIAFVHKPPESPWTYGLGMFGVGGFSLNYPASTTDPILMRRTGLGRISSRLEVIQLVPTMSRAVTEHLSIGFAPTVTMAKLNADPFPFAAPDDANHDGSASYPSGSGSRYSWGGGFQIGAYYVTDSAWHFGASLKSQQWMEEFRFKSEDEVGRPRTLEFDLDYPLLLSLGTAYTGFEKWTLACDVRYFNYGATPGFDSTGYDATGAVRGLGWRSVWAVYTGVQREITDRLSVRAGYSYNENPIDSSLSIYNVESPLVFQHVLHIGASYQFTDNWSFALGYGHAFENSITGPYVTPMGTIPGASVTNSVSVDTLDAGITVRF